MDLDDFHTVVDAIRDRQGQVEDGAFSADVIPFVLLCIDAFSSTRSTVAPVPLEVQVVNWDVVDGSSGRE